jgi:hypothetical protein
MSYQALLAEVRDGVASLTRDAGFCCALAGLISLGACADPRSRPGPPTVEVTLDAAHAITSPGEIIGSIYAYDEHGLDSMTVSIHSADERLIGDSTFFSPDPFETTRPLIWQVPAGMAAHTGIQVVVRVVSYIGFAAADTVIAAVGGTLR